MKTTLRTLAFFVLVILFAVPAAGQVPNQLKYSIPAPFTALQRGANLGSSVAVDGNYIVAGAPNHSLGGYTSGVVKVFNAETGALLLLLSNPSPASFDRFGDSVAISGTRVVVGAAGDDTGAENAGSAYVYDLNSATPTVPVVTLNNPSPATDDGFGGAVAISGTLVVVGASGDETGANGGGSAYVYDLSSGTPTVPAVTLNNPNPPISPTVSYYFGHSVAISGTRVVVGNLPRYKQMTLGPGGPGNVYVYDLSSSTPAVPMVALNNPGPPGTYWFGIAVAISGTRLVVGAGGDNFGAGNNERTFVYDLSSATPTVPVVTLNYPGAQFMELDHFGKSVAISGTRVVVGAARGITSVTHVGVAFVYDLSNATPTVPVATLNNPNPSGDDFYSGNFGRSVAITGTRVVVGTPQDSGGSIQAGSVYVYDVSSGTPTVPVSTLNNPGPASGDSFGLSIAISGRRVVVGAPYDSTGVGAAGNAYVYDLSSATPTVPVATLNNPGPAFTGADNFGTSVAISGTRVVVGAYSTNSRVAGSAYVYDLSGGTPTVPVTTLINPNPKSNDRFGASVAISGTRVVVGDWGPGDGPEAAGSAYVYDLSSGTPTVPVTTLNNPGPADVDFFGYSVAISGTRVVVGALFDFTVAAGAGSAHVYDLSSGTPTVPVATLNNPGPAVESFGNAVAISGMRVVVGASGDFTGAGAAGNVFVYDLSSGTPAVPVVTLNNPSPEDFDQFGKSVAISGTRVVVGARYDSTGAIDAGSVYVYDLSSGTPAVPVATLNNPRPVAYNAFGTSVAIDGTTVAIGTENEDTVPFDKGTAYIFGPGTEVDTLAPETTILSCPSGVVNSRAATITFNANEAATFTASLDGGAFVAATSPVTLTALAEGTHTFRVRATDLAGNTDATPATCTWTVDSIPPETTIVSCPTGAVNSSTANITFNSNEAAVSFVASLGSGAAGAVTSPKSYTGLADSTYTFYVRAIDAAGNVDPTPATCTWTVDTVPPTTRIDSGPTGTVSNRKATLTFSANEGVATFVCSLDGGPESAVTSPVDYAQLAQGQHTFRVRATDAAGNPDPARASRTWMVDTVAPETTILSGPGGTGSTAKFKFTSDDPTATFMASRDNAAEVVVTSPVKYNFLLEGPHSFSVRAIDAVGNRDESPAVVSWVVERGNPNPPPFLEGAAVPGAGTPAAPPADAVLAGFGAAAIDEDGTVVLGAKWTSASVGDGRGIFTATGSVAQVGGSVPGVEGATFATLADPVIDGGHVAFLATLNDAAARAVGVRTQAAAGRTGAVFSDAPTGALALVARAGEAAPGADGATFKSFHGAAVSGTTVVVFGKLKVGSGSPPVGAASDAGLWAVDATHPLTLLLREGQAVEGRTIKKLVSFKAGDGSPGQGRGWLRTPEGGAAQVMALAFFTDKTQAVLSAGLDGVVTALSQSGAVGAGGPDLAEASFASYGVPAVNATGHAAFRALMGIGTGGVTEANAIGIFLRPPGETLYTPVARIGDPFGTKGARVSALKDPVLASDGSIAFPTTVKGGGVRGFARRLLCWQPPGKPLALLAQGGSEPAGIPGAQWEAFTSLAIAADRGPIFVASLVVGPGGVAKSTSKGVWAMDATGALQLLFRTGDQIGGKTVRRFEVLNAVPGSVGVTRSFNDSGVVLWKATFTDGTQAIVTTQIL